MSIDLAKALCELDYPAEGDAFRRLRLPGIYLRNCGMRDLVQIIKLLMHISALKEKYPFDIRITNKDVYDIYYLTFDDLANDVTIMAQYLPIEHIKHYDLHDFKYKLKNSAIVSVYGAIVMITWVEIFGLRNTIIYHEILTKDSYAKIHATIQQNRECVKLAPYGKYYAYLL